MSAESKRLLESSDRSQHWKRFGPYLSDRQWGTVREDYSADGDAWNYFPHEHARSRAYRWGEDGLLGICDRQCRLCFAIALWNEKDSILKERLFGLTNPEGNHGEDVKEVYFHTDSTPTHSYMLGEYVYPQAAYPYQQLLEQNQKRSRAEREFELIDTGVLDDRKYFDVAVEYAKGDPSDILIRITVTNSGPVQARLHLLPTVWFRNSWIWGCSHEGCEVKPNLEYAGDNDVVTQHTSLERFRFQAQADENASPKRWLFTDNESNNKLLFGTENYSPYVKDAFHRLIIQGDEGAVNPRQRGTKAAAWYVLDLPAGAKKVIKCRLTSVDRTENVGLDDSFDQIFAKRQSEADEFFEETLSHIDGQEEKQIARQAYAGLCWTKQFYHLAVKEWLAGDPEQPTPPAERARGRNSDWTHVFNRDILSVPDKWEYPWFAAWDSAFHMVAMARIDPEFAKDQLLLFLREWYMHPNGQIPAYEYSFSDVNPPVHAWACWRVYKIADAKGSRDVLFLKRAFQKLLINFTWWVNRKDVAGKHLFAGGFLGLDNIGVFDRSRPLPTGGHLEQADGTAWMAFYGATMLSMAIELSMHDPSYEDIASKFFEHFVAIADAINNLGGTGLWDEGDGFYYDQLWINNAPIPIKIRSTVGLIPLIAAEVFTTEEFHSLPGFSKRMEWFLQNRPDLAKHVSYMNQQETPGAARGNRLLAIPSRERLERVLHYLLDESEFLSPFGIRSLSKKHETNPFVFSICGTMETVRYEPGESNSGLFGGNSNWRGPIWLPINFLLVEALQRYHFFYGDSLTVECPTGSGNRMNLKAVAKEIARRLVRIFKLDHEGKRACFGTSDRWYRSIPSQDRLCFHEYFHGETGEGLGASHQTGWTSLIAPLLHKLHRTSH